MLKKGSWMNVDRFLTTIPLLADLGDDTLSVLAHTSRLVTFAPGESIIRQDEPASDTFALISGKARVTKDLYGASVTIAFLAPGDIFGEIAHMIKAPHTANVIAEVQSECIVIPKATWMDIVNGNDALALRLLRLAVKRLAELESKASSAAAAIWI